MPRIGISRALLAGFRHLELHRLGALEPEPAAVGLAARRARRRAPPCSRDTSRARRRRPSSRRDRPPTSRPRSRRGRAAAARLAAARPNSRSWRAGNSRSTMRRPSPAYCVRTAARVARRIAARALPVTTIDSQAAGGAVCAFEVRISHLVAVLQLRLKRRDLAVDLGAHRHVADVGMHRVGEVDRRSPRAATRSACPWGEAEHLVVEQFELGVLEEFLGVGAFGQQLDGAAQPGIGIAIRATASRSASRRRPCRARARRCRIRRSGASRGCGSAARRAACRDRSPWYGSSGNRSASASRCSP